MRRPFLPRFLFAVRRGLFFPHRGKTGGGDFWVPNVVFTCGAVPAADREVIGPDDEILVYYGAADTAIGVAKGRLRDLVPEVPA